MWYRNNNLISNDYLRFALAAGTGITGAGTGTSSLNEFKTVTNVEEKKSRIKALIPDIFVSLSGNGPYTLLIKDKWGQDDEYKNDNTYTGTLDNLYEIAKNIKENSEKYVATPAQKNKFYDSSGKLIDPELVVDRNFTTLPSELSNKVTQNPNQPGALIYPAFPNGKMNFEFGVSRGLGYNSADDYNKLVDNGISFEIEVTPKTNNPKEFNEQDVKITVIGTAPSDTLDSIEKIKTYIKNNIIVNFPTDANSKLLPFKHTVTLEGYLDIPQTIFTPTQYTPQLKFLQTDEELVVKIDGREIGKAYNYKPFLFDSRNIYMLEGRHVVEFYGRGSNNASMNPQPGLVESIIIELKPNQPLQILAKGTGPLPSAYNGAPVTTKRSRALEQEKRERIKDMRERNSPENIAKREKNITNFKEGLTNEAIKLGLTNTPSIPEDKRLINQKDLSERGYYEEYIGQNLNNYYHYPDRRKQLADEIKSWRPKRRGLFGIRGL